MVRRAIPLGPASLALLAQPRPARHSIERGRASSVSAECIADAVAQSEHEETVKQEKIKKAPRFYRIVRSLASPIRLMFQTTEEPNVCRQITTFGHLLGLRPVACRPASIAFSGR